MNEQSKNTNRIVRDFWKALKVSTIITLTTLGLIIGFLIVNNEHHYIDINTTPNQLLNFLIFISLIVFIRVYVVYIKGVSLIDGIFSWPASDVENSFIDLFTLKRIRGFFYRESVNAIQIEYVTNDFGYQNIGNKKTKVYGLNISGDFGSRTIRFNSKQKRDEARNVLKNFSKTRMEADIAFN